MWFFRFHKLYGVTETMPARWAGAKQGYCIQAKRMLDCRHPLGDKCGTLAKPWPLRSHDFNPTPPPAPLAILDSGSCGSRSELQPIAESDLDSFTAALLEDEQVDLWADA